MKGAAFGFIVTAVLGASLGAFADQDRQDGKRRSAIKDGVVVDGVAVGAALTSALDELAQIERINDQSRDKKTKIKIARRIADLRSDLQLLQEDVALAEPADRWKRGRDRDRDRDRDDDDDRDRYQQPDKDRRAVSYSLGDAEIDTSGRWVTTAQIIRIMDELSFSNDRIEVAAMLHPNCSDPESFYLVYSHLAFDADRATLKKRLGQ
jgi:hypothetical protein